jgi:UDP-N-acetylmuramate dehydrogenase
VFNLRKSNQKINIPFSCSLKEPMRKHTSFRIGGPADYFCSPATSNEIKRILEYAISCNLPVFILGAGANILVSDEGVRGIVIDMVNFKDFSFTEDNKVTAQAGVQVHVLAEAAAARNLSGIEFFFGLPGSVGGSIYMNARCYGVSTADVLSGVTYIDESLEIKEYSPNEGGFSYKSSPFQKKKSIILQGEFMLRPGEGKKILETMQSYRQDREQKGHYTFPSAGSIFKNNRDFGLPTGKIVDSLGLRGYKIGGAMVSPEHANIIVNTGGASAADVKKLIDYIKKKVFRTYGYALEEEIRYIGGPI